MNHIIGIIALMVVIALPLRANEWASVGQTGPWQVKMTIRVAGHESMGYLAFVEDRLKAETTPWDCYISVTGDMKVGQVAPSESESAYRSIRLSLIESGVLVSVKSVDGIVRSTLLSPQVESGSVHYRGGVVLSYINEQNASRPLPSILVEAYHR